MLFSDFSDEDCEDSLTSELLSDSEILLSDDGGVYFLVTSGFVNATFFFTTGSWMISFSAAFCSLLRT